MSYQTSSNGRRRSGFWLVPENLCFNPSSLRADTLNLYAIRGPAAPQAIIRQKSVKPKQSLTLIRKVLNCGQ